MGVVLFARGLTFCQRRFLRRKYPAVIAVNPLALISKGIDNCIDNSLRCFE
jgi:hypothetical protein